MRVAVDTNVLAYAEGINGAEKRLAAWTVIGKIRSENPAVPAQVLGELFHVLVRKAGLSSDRARVSVLEWSGVFQVVDTASATLFKATDLAADHNLQIWDAIILCAASEAGCRLLLSEDMQDGFTWGGVTVANPFAVSLNPSLAALLER